MKNNTTYFADDQFTTDCHALSMACGFYMIHFMAVVATDAEIVGHCNDRHREFPLFEMTEYEFKLGTPTRDMFLNIWEAWDIKMEAIYAAEPGVYHSDDLVYFDYLYFGM